jgi:hypothetical protein
MKLGLDFHGVVDRYPKAFAEMTKALTNAGHEVHIITGHRDNRDLRESLSALNIHYTHIFSITSYHELNGTPVKYDEKGNPWMDTEIWNATKGWYCDSHGIDFHIDDSPDYGKYFKTTAFFTYTKEPTNVS